MVDNGVVLDVDKGGRALQAARKLDNLSPKVIAHGVNRLTALPKKPRRQELNINKVAEDYANIIKRVVS